MGVLVVNLFKFVKIISVVFIIVKYIFKLNMIVLVSFVLLINGILK